jgi:hypothetical protein
LTRDEVPRRFSGSFNSARLCQGRSISARSIRPPAIFGSDGCNGKISKNFGEIPQDDNKMKRKSRQPGTVSSKIVRSGPVFRFSADAQAASISDERMFSRI